MNKVTTVNLNGNAFQLEDTGYEALRDYLAAAAAQLTANPDRDEILSDIEQSIADKFRALLGAYKTVVTAAQVGTVIAEMGPVDGGAQPSGAAAAGAGGAAARPASEAGGTPAGVKHLYRLYDGAIFSGVCNGLAAFFNIDPTIVRLIFIVLTILTTGAWALVYLVMMFVVPAADTPAQKTAAHGATATAQEFIRRARQGYYEGLKSFPDRAARREWKRRFRQQMRGWRHSFQWEMQAGAQQWQQHWQQRCAPHPGFGPGLSLVAPFLTVIHAALALACVTSLVSLLTTGAVFGLAPPVGVPVWIAVIVLLVAYSIVVLPLKLARHVYRYQVGTGPYAGVGALVHLWDALVWVVFVVVLIWLGHRHFPQVIDAIHRIPSLFHEAVGAIRHWWSS